MREVIRNATKLYQFCQVKLTKVSKESSIVRNRCLLLVDPNEEKTFPDDIDTCQYKSITDTMKLHQVTNKVSLKSGIFIRNLICTCIPCQDHIWHICLKRTISRKSHFNGTILGVYKKKTVTI